MFFRFLVKASQATLPGVSGNLLNLGAAVPGTPCDPAGGPAIFSCPSTGTPRDPAGSLNDPPALMCFPPVVIIWPGVSQARPRRGASRTCARVCASVRTHLRRSCSMWQCAVSSQATMCDAMCFVSTQATCWKEHRASGVTCRQQFFPPPCSSWEAARSRTIMGISLPSLPSSVQASETMSECIRVLYGRRGKQP